MEATTAGNRGNGAAGVELTGLQASKLLGITRKKLIKLAARGYFSMRTSGNAQGMRVHIPLDEVSALKAKLDGGALTLAEILPRQKWGRPKGSRNRPDLKGRQIGVVWQVLQLKLINAKLDLICNRLNLNIVGLEEKVGIKPGNVALVERGIARAIQEAEEAASTSGVGVGVGAVRLS